MGFVPLWATVATPDERGLPYIYSAHYIRELDITLAVFKYIFDVLKVNKSYCSLLFSLYEQEKKESFNANYFCVSKYHKLCV